MVSTSVPKPSRPSGKPIPVRLSDKLLQRLKRASEETGLSIQDVIRLSADVGLIRIEKTGYQIAESVYAVAEEKLGDDSKKAPGRQPSQAKQ